MCSRGRVYILPRFLFFLSVIFLLQAENDDFYGKRGSSMKMKKEKLLEYSPKISVSDTVKQFKQYETQNTLV